MPEKPPAKKIVPVLVALAASLGGCGGGSDKDSGPSFEGSGNPQCSEVWKVGATLDLNKYTGCDDGEMYLPGMSSGCYDSESGDYRGQYATFKNLWVLQTGTDPKTGAGGTPGKVTDVDPKC